MKRSWIVILAGVIPIAFVTQLRAYEVPVHGRMTNEAYQKSVLADAEFLNRLGIENNEDPFGETYFDVSGSGVKARTIKDYERDECMAHRWHVTRVNGYD